MCAFSLVLTINREHGTTGSCVTDCICSVHHHTEVVDSRCYYLVAVDLDVSRLKHCTTHGCYREAYMFAVLRIDPIDSSSW